MISNGPALRNTTQHAPLVVIGTILLTLMMSGCIDTLGITIENPNYIAMRGVDIKVHPEHSEPDDTLALVAVKLDGEYIKFSGDMNPYAFNTNGCRPENYRFYQAEWSHYAKWLNQPASQKKTVMVIDTSELALGEHQIEIIDLHWRGGYTHNEYCNPTTRDAASGAVYIVTVVDDESEVVYVDRDVIINPPKEDLSFWDTIMRWLWGERNE